MGEWLVVTVQEIAAAAYPHWSHSIADNKSVLENYMPPLMEFVCIKH